jgi:RimJ/RimL family protein N-acetyltransferase
MFTSKRLILRKFESVDLDFLYSLDNDAEVMRYINGGIDTPREFIANNILPLFTHYDDSKPGIGYWVVTRNNDPQPLGWCCLREIGNLSQVGSIGYRFDKT